LLLTGLATGWLHGLVVLCAVERPTVLPAGANRVLSGSFTVVARMDDGEAMTQNAAFHS
jgi:hypothetical protein